MILGRYDRVFINIKLQRWSDPAVAGWFSGDTHLHRTVEELRNVLLAEDLNVALPLTSWVTFANKPPASGDKNIQDSKLSSLIKVDQQHVIWPRNTEYEIFSVKGKQHTLGALFVLGHHDSLQQTVDVAASAIDLPIVGSTFRPLSVGSICLVKSRTIRRVSRRYFRSSL